MTTTTLLAFSIGAQAVIVAFNIVIGLIAIFVLFGHIRIGSIRRDANSWPDPDQSTSPAN
jgi:hypothetical protein